MKQAQLTHGAENEAASPRQPSDLVERPDWIRSSCHVSVWGPIVSLLPLLGAAP